MTEGLLCILVLFVCLMQRCGAELGVLQTQCQCTCPIDTKQLQDAIDGNRNRYVLEDEPIVKHAIPAQTEPITSPTTAPLPVTTSVEPGSGEEDTYPSNNYNIDEVYSDETVDIGPSRGDITVTVMRSRPPASLMDSPDDEAYMEPMAANAAETIITGQKGEKGNTGDRGPPGLNGVNGLDGAVGEKGDTGPPGERGPAGPKGNEGGQGPRGFPGAMGLQGYRGSPGPMGESGRQGPRGSDGARGPRGEQGVIGRRGLPGKPGSKGEPGERGAPGKDTITELKYEKVAFLSRLLDHFGPSKEMTHIIFSQIDFNLGSGYDPSSGAFNVPVDGVYVFHLQVMAMADHIAWLAVQVNGEPVAYAWASGYTSATEQMGTAMTIQQLKRGDVVNIIQKASDNPPNYLYAHYTLFSGYRIG